MGIQKANASWKGTLKEGQGVFSIPKGKYEGEYTFASRFEDENKTNPEELVGAALASCFSMFLSALVSKENFTPTYINTNAEVTLESTDNGPKITQIELKTEADIPSLNEEDFQNYVTKAKENCPISKLYQGTTITVNATLLTTA